MNMRERFDYDLETLRNKLIQLGSLAEVAVSKAIHSLEEQNIELALQVIDEDIQVDMINEEINDFSILLIAKQQPVATDLRRIIVATRIASDIERMADFAVNIAKSTIRVGQDEKIVSLNNIKKMHEIASKMLSLSIKAFNEEDVVLAKNVADMDDEVDDLYGVTIRELLELTPQNKEWMNQLSQLFFVAKYIERIADHATNISESILYLVKGRHYDLNN
ncbi:phosphate signaling complex protein PhoU [Bacillus carboniphilus]|uniref:Phosphate-specific transport system accessory protein PhoU n=1 Tax=Bacillus carboniphilus TaxID=86663 RepID=A0ABY9JZT6_9BACI|nr:phosphate signaling complex protein PhoU [Bacillus carboniphilus]WLR43950.1 phosphate signaling complex protein PhoU [Bacillus carboniphilus]